MFSGCGKTTSIPVLPEEQGELCLSFGALLFGAIGRVVDDQPRDHLKFFSGDLADPVFVVVEGSDQPFFPVPIAIVLPPLVPFALALPKVFISELAE